MSEAAAAITEDVATTSAHNAATSDAAADDNEDADEVAPAPVAPLPPTMHR